MNKRILIGVGVVTVAALTAGAVLLVADSDPTHQIGPNTASPAYVVVNTPTPVTFTSVIADSNLKKQDPKKVLLVRTDTSGTPIDILGRMNDRGKKADTNKNDHTYTIQVTLNEAAVGQAQFRIAAKFKDVLLKGNDADEDWDQDLAALNDPRAKGSRHDRLPPLLRKLQRYTLSGPIQVTVDPFKLPPDPGEAGKQTLAGIDSDHDGVRDDVQRFIATAYFTAPDEMSAARQFEQTIQKMLVSSLSPQDVTDLNRQLRADNDCLEYVVGPQNGYTVFRDVLAATLNTAGRGSAYTKFQSVQIQQGYLLTPFDSLKAGCTFRPGSH